MIDLSEVVNDPDMGESYTIIRNSGKFVAGGWQVTNTSEIKAFGIVSVASSRDLKQVPEGDRIEAAMVFYSITEMMMTREGATSDILRWEGEEYRVLKSSPYGTRGYWKAIACRIKGM